MKIESLNIVLKEDDCSQRSDDLGEFTDQVEPGVISTRTWDFLKWHFGEPVDVPAKGGRNYRFFKPYAGGEEVGTKLYYKYGRQDAERMHGLCEGWWSYVGVVANATVSYPTGINGHHRMETLTSTGIWGVESDCTDYIRELAGEQLDELRDHLGKFGIKVSDEDWGNLVETATDEAQI